MVKKAQKYQQQNPQFIKIGDRFFFKKPVPFFSAASTTLTLPAAGSTDGAAIDKVSAPANNIITTGRFIISSF